MAELISMTYEQARAEHFKSLKDEAKRKMNYWATRVYRSRPNCLNDPASIKASEYAAEYSYYNDALEALENQPKWLSPAEGLPEPNTAVIVALDDGHVFQARYNYDGWDLWEGCTRTVMCWMPLPEPPKEEA